MIGRGAYRTSISAESTPINFEDREHYLGFEKVEEIPIPDSVYNKIIELNGTGKYSLDGICEFVSKELATPSFKFNPEPQTWDGTNTVNDASVDIKSTIDYDNLRTDVNRKRNSKFTFVEVTKKQALSGDGTKCEVLKFYFDKDENDFVLNIKCLRFFDDHYSWQKKARDSEYVIGAKSRNDIYEHIFPQ